MMNSKPDRPETKKSLSRTRIVWRYLNVLLDILVGIFFIWLSQSADIDNAVIPPWGYLLIGIALIVYGLYGIIRLWRKR
ncbi:MAG: hypothetical protein ACRCX4_10695 [Bacteroidales bacterium]